MTVVTAKPKRATKPLITITTGPKNARTDPDSGLRFYSWQGVEYPSVTSVRNLAGMPHKLANWRTNQVIERAMVEYPTLGTMLKDATPEVTATWLRRAMTEKRDAAANLGTRVHDAAAGGMTLAKAPPDLAPFLLHYYKWMEKSKIEVLLAERQVWSPSVGYAGTFDMIGRFPSGDWLIDLKTGSGVYPEHALQLEAYARADFVGEDDIEDAAATALLHGIAGRAILHLRPEGWSFQVVPASQETWFAFRGLLQFANWAHVNPDITSLTGKVVSG